MVNEAEGGDGSTRPDGGPVAEPADAEESESAEESVTEPAAAEGSGTDEESVTETTDTEESGTDEETVAEPADAEGRETDDGDATTTPSDAPDPPDAGLPADVRAYDRFEKVDRATYERVNDFLRDRTYITAREWAIARLCADFRTGTGVEMTKIGENLPHLVPFMTDTYSPQAVNQARSAFEEKVHMSGATFLYGAMSGFFTADELDDLMYEVTEVAKFLLEVEGVELSVEEELEAEDRISEVMRDVRAASDELRHEGVCCPECGNEFDVDE